MVSPTNISIQDIYGKCNQNTQYITFGRQGYVEYHRKNIEREEFESGTTG